MIYCVVNVFSVVCWFWICCLVVVLVEIFNVIGELRISLVMLLGCDVV